MAKRAAEPFSRNQSIDEAIEALRAGELVVFPTETFYAIAADAFAPAALARLFALKGRAAEKTIALIAHDTSSAFALAREVPEVARRLALSFWPGPLTLVMPARAGLAPQLTGADGVGVRVSPHPVARALAQGIGHPITATSANRAGAPPPVTLAAARAALGSKVKVYLEGGILAGSAPSTIVACDAAGWRLIRAGAVRPEAIAAALSIEGLK